MNNDEAIAHISPAPQGGLTEEMPTCGECGGWGLGCASVEHHHTCTVAAAITDWCPIVCGDEHWTGWLGHELPGDSDDE